MPDLLIKENELKVLDQIIAPIPTQYGLPLVNFFTQVSNLRNQEAQQNSEGKKQVSKEDLGEKLLASPVGKKK